MCGRIALNTPADVLARLFGAAIPSAYVPRYNIAPTQQTLIVCADENGRSALLARWGFSPPWQREGHKGPEPINARSESAAKSRLYGPALKGRRCVVPASGFYEWQTVEGQKQKRPYFIRPADDQVFTLAGLWSRREGPTGDPVDTFAILTRPANKAMKMIHHRMPVILPRIALEPWLDPSLKDVSVITQLLDAPNPPSIAAHEVSTWVNSPAHDDPRCAEPVSPR